MLFGAVDAAPPDGSGVPLRWQTVQVRCHRTRDGVVRIVVLTDGVGARSVDAHHHTGCAPIPSVVRQLRGADDGGVHAVGDRAGGAEFDVGEPGGFEALAVIGEGEGSGDTADVVAALGTLVGGEGVVGDDVGDSDPARGVLGFGVGGFSAAMPGVILAVTPKSETSSAMSFNYVVRSVGYSLGSAIGGLILAAGTGPGHLFPDDSAYTTAALVGIGAMAITTLTSLTLARRRSSETNR